MLTLEDLESIQADAMADDIEIDFNKMSLWTREQAVTFFETGEEPPPPWQPEPYLMGQLDKAGLGHLKDILGKKEAAEFGTVHGLVDFMRNDRPKFLPKLKELGVAKLPDRQKLRDIINEIANPPEGSEHKLREEYKAEFDIWPWAVVQSEKYIVEAEVDTMVTKLPTDRPLKRYVVRNLTKGMSGITISKGRSASSGVVGATGLIFENGEEIVGDEESWSVTDPTLRVHVYVPNKVQPSMGYLQGWANFVDLLPLDEAGNPPERKEVSDFAIQRLIQDYFEDGYYQLSLCRAIKSGISDKPEGMTFRQALDLVYMKVRGPALIKLGYMPTNKGLAEYMDTNDIGPDPSVPYSHLSDADYVALQDAHNRIVALMGGQNPANIVDALAGRKAGKQVDMGAAFEAEPEAAEEAPAAEGAEGAEGAPATDGAPAAADAAPAAAEVS